MTTIRTNQNRFAILLSLLLLFTTFTSASSNIEVTGNTQLSLDSYDRESVIIRDGGRLEVSNQVKFNTNSFIIEEGGVLTTKQSNGEGEIEINAENKVEIKGKVGIQNRNDFSSVDIHTASEGTSSEIIKYEGAEFQFQHEEYPDNTLTTNSSGKLVINNTQFSLQPDIPDHSHGSTSFTINSQDNLSLIGSNIDLGSNANHGLVKISSNRSINLKDSQINQYNSGDEEDVSGLDIDAIEEVLIENFDANLDVDYASAGDLDITSEQSFIEIDNLNYWGSAKDGRIDPNNYDQDASATTGDALIEAKDNITIESSKFSMNGEEGCSGFVVGGDPSHCDGNRGGNLDITTEEGNVSLDSTTKIYSNGARGGNDYEGNDFGKAGDAGDIHISGGKETSVIEFYSEIQAKGGDTSNTDYDGYDYRSDPPAPSAGDAPDINLKGKKVIYDPNYDTSFSNGISNGDGSDGESPELNVEYRKQKDIQTESISSSDIQTTILNAVPTIVSTDLINKSSGKSITSSEVMYGTPIALNTTLKDEENDNITEVIYSANIVSNQGSLIFSNSFSEENGARTLENLSSGKEKWQSSSAIVDCFDCVVEFEVESAEDSLGGNNVLNSKKEIEILPPVLKTPNYNPSNSRIDSTEATIVSQVDRFGDFKNFTFTLEYRNASGDWNVVENVTRSHDDVDMTDSVSASIDGLSHDTVYDYRFNASHNPEFSETGTFETEDNSEPFIGNFSIEEFSDNEIGVNASVTEKVFSINQSETDIIVKNSTGGVIASNATLTNVDSDGVDQDNLTLTFDEPQSPEKYEVVVEAEDNSSNSVSNSKTYTFNRPSLSLNTKSDIVVDPGKSVSTNTVTADADISDQATSLVSNSYDNIEHVVCSLSTSSGQYNQNTLETLSSSNVDCALEYTEPGKNTLKVTVVDNSGLQTTKTREVNVTHVEESVDEATDPVEVENIGDSISPKFTFEIQNSFEGSSNGSTTIKETLEIDADIGKDDLQTDRESFNDKLGLTEEQENKLERIKSEIEDLTQIKTDIESINKQNTLTKTDGSNRTILEMKNNLSSTYTDEDGNWTDGGAETDYNTLKSVTNTYSNSDFEESDLNGKISVDKLTLEDIETELSELETAKNIAWNENVSLTGAPGDYTLELEYNDISERTETMSFQTEIESADKKIETGRFPRGPKVAFDVPDFYNETLKASTTIELDEPVNVYEGSVDLRVARKENVSSVNPSDLQSDITTINTTNTTKNPIQASNLNTGLVSQKIDGGNKQEKLSQLGSINRTMVKTHSSSALYVEESSDWRTVDVSEEDMVIQDEEITAVHATVKLSEAVVQVQKDESDALKTRETTEETTEESSSSGGGGGGGGGGLGALPSQEDEEENTSQNTTADPASVNCQENGLNQYTCTANNSETLVDLQIGNTTENGSDQLTLNIDTLGSTPSQVSRIEAENNLTVTIEKFLEIEPSVQEADIESATVEFRSSKVWIENQNGSRENITLQRYHNDEWQELETRPVGESEDSVVFEAETPGFSYFAVTLQQRTQQPGSGTTQSSFSNISGQFFTGATSQLGLILFAVFSVVSAGIYIGLGEIKKQFYTAAVVPKNLVVNMRKKSEKRIASVKKYFRNRAERIKQRFMAINYSLAKVSAPSITLPQISTPDIQMPTLGKSEEEKRLERKQNIEEQLDNLEKDLEAAVDEEKDIQKARVKYEESRKKLANGNLYGASEALQKAERELESAEKLKSANLKLLKADLKSTSMMYPRTRSQLAEVVNKAMNLIEETQGHFTKNQVVELIKQAYKDDLMEKGEWVWDDIKDLSDTVESQISENSQIEQQKVVGKEAYYSKKDRITVSN